MIVGADVFERIVWNRQNRVIESAEQQLRNFEPTSIVDPAMRSEIERDRVMAAAWLLRVIECGARNEWLWLWEQHGSFAERAFRWAFSGLNVGEGDAEELGFWVMEAGRDRVRFIGPGSWRVLDELYSTLPAPLDKVGSDWSLELGPEPAFERPTRRVRRR
jgi:hypothetical protein